MRQIDLSQINLSHPGNAIGPENRPDDKILTFWLQGIALHHSAVSDAR